MALSRPARGDPLDRGNPIGAAPGRDNGEPTGLGSSNGFLRGPGLLADAYGFAAAVHAGQHQELSGPYIEHPVAVARLLHEAGFGEHVVAAGLLHDVVEHVADGLTMLPRLRRELDRLADRHWRCRNPAACRVGDYEAADRAANL